MISIIVNGKHLDLPENINLQFQKSNILFAFDDAKTERTMSFSIPRTANNMQALDFSNDLHFAGTAMRGRLDAQLQINGVPKDGYLYVDSYGDDKFNCVFVTGELLGLQKIREAGKLADFITPTLGAMNNATTINANQSAFNDYARIKYKTDGYMFPNWRMEAIALDVAQNAGISVDWTNVFPQLNTHRIIPPKAQGIPEQEIHITRIPFERPTSTEPYPLLNGLILTTTGDDLSAILPIDETRLLREVAGTWENPEFRYGYIRQFKAMQDLVLHFADNTSDDIFLGFVDVGTGVAFLGDYSFARNGDGSVVTTGEPLKGRDVEINVGQLFMLFTPNDEHYTDEQPTYAGGYYISGYLDCDIVIKGKDEQPENAFIRVKDNVPDITIVDYIKTLAALSGTLLAYDGTIRFIGNNMTYETIYSKNVIEVNALRKTFGSYGQNNRIVFESGESVLENNRISINYPIANINLATENELQRIPFSEGGLEYDSDIPVGYVNSEDEVYTILMGGYVYLARVTLPTNEYLQDLTIESTSISLKVFIKYFEFDAINYKKRIFYDGCLWTWTEASYSGDVVTLSLSKVQ